MQFTNIELTIMVLEHEAAGENAWQAQIISGFLSFGSN